MKRHVSFFALPLPIILAALLLLPQQGGPVQTEPDLPTEEVTVSFYADYPTYPSLEQMCDAADIIVTGQYTEYLSSWNMNREASDPSKEDPNTYSEGRLYAFQVDQVLKGQAPEAITVNKQYSLGARYYVGQVDGEHVYAPYQMPTPYCIEPEYGRSYILFLSYDPQFDHYFAVGEPWEILLRPDGSAELKSLIFGDEPQAAPLSAEAKTEDAIYRIIVENDDIGRYEDFIAPLSAEQVMEQIRSALS